MTRYRQLAPAVSPVAVRAPQKGACRERAPRDPYRDCAHSPPS